MAARLTDLAGQRVANGKDFDPQTGAFRNGDNVVLLDETTAHSVAEKLKSSVFRVDSVIETPFSALWTSSSARLLFSPVSFLRLFSSFHLPSNNVVSNTIHVYRQHDKNPERY